jgi:hypothetical protein
VKSCFARSLQVGFASLGFFTVCECALLLLLQTFFTAHEVPSFPNVDDSAAVSPDAFSPASSNSSRLSSASHEV